MPQLSAFYGIIVYLYYFDHNPPHLHAEYGEFEVILHIDDFSVLEGYFPPKALSLLLEWATIHKNELQDAWKLASTGEKPEKIQPLL
jgi:hypothetical protein